MGHALSIQKVTSGSVADLVGLCAGDLLVCINQKATRFMKHDEAKMEIIRSSNDFDIVIERSYAVSVPSAIQFMSADSDSFTIPQAINCSPKRPVVSVNLQISPLASDSHSNWSGLHSADVPAVSHSTPLPGSAVIGQTPCGRIQKVSAAAYNSPMGLYSKQNSEDSFAGLVATSSICPGSMKQGLPLTSMKGGLRCAACDELIRDKMVRVSNRRTPMHPECLKCVKCGIGLRNVGYFCIDDSLYCELHAKQAAPPPEHGMKPVIVFK